MSTPPHELWKPTVWYPWIILVQNDYQEDLVMQRLLYIKWTTFNTKYTTELSQTLRQKTFYAYMPVTEQRLSFTCSWSIHYKLNILVQYYLFPPNLIAQRTRLLCLLPVASIYELSIILWMWKYVLVYIVSWYTRKCIAERTTSCSSLVFCVTLYLYSWGFSIHYILQKYECIYLHYMMHQAVTRVTVVTCMVTIIKIIKSL